MTQPVAINRRIIEGLYSEALVLSDEVRAAFDLSGRSGHDAAEDSAEGQAARIELSSEALRTTTRMMHALAWLLNQRAYLAGELSEHQLRRYGRLPPDRKGGEADAGDLLLPDTLRLIRDTRHFYARLQRLDREWRERDASPPVAALRERLGSALAK
jgi:regulator of CtrA degradation